MAKDTEFGVTYYAVADQESIADGQKRIEAIGWRPSRGGALQAPGVFLGRYSPFAGVWYYAILDERDVAEGRTKIEVVGWRLPKKETHEQEEVPAPLSDAA